MKDKNGKSRIELTQQEIEAIRTLALDRLKGELSSKVRDETLGGLVIKASRASQRLKASATA